MKATNTTTKHRIFPWIKGVIAMGLVALLFPAGAQIPAGYYNSAEGKSGTELQATLHQLIDNHTVLSYAALWDAFYTTDDRAGNLVWDIYSDRPGGTPDFEFTLGTGQCVIYHTEGDCYNREHSFPKSWFDEQAPMQTDLFHIYPVDGYVNGRRSNYPYGETDAPYWTSTNGSRLGPSVVTGYDGRVFEPIDAYKGDLARTYFYMATRYYGEDGNWPGSDMCDGAQPRSWALAMLLQWHANDPVSAKETERNNAVYALQGNRNPFVDHPEYVSYIWDGQAPEDPTLEPEAPVEEPELAQAPDQHVNDFSSAFITLQWVDATGSNLPTGYLVVYGSEGFDSLPVPEDGTAPESYSGARVVPYGREQLTLGNLAGQTTYYIKIYAFSGAGTATDYKTDGTVPQLHQMSN